VADPTVVAEGRQIQQHAVSSCAQAHEAVKRIKSSYPPAAVQSG
jgi:hypothetical protein